MQIQLKNIHKYFGKIKANNGISLSINPGAIHGILGENGAGKSTLMKIVSGLSKKTKGTIFIDSKPVDYSSPYKASHIGIGMLHQEPLDFPLLTVLDNFMIGQVNGIKNKNKKFAADFKKLAQELNFSIIPDTIAGRMTVGERQQLEIMRLLSSGVRTLILDEPTTGISESQKNTLFQALKRLTKKGKSIILVSHKLEDVESLCDQVTVLRQGKVSGSMQKPFATNKILQMMFGSVPDSFQNAGAKHGNSILKIKNLSAPGGRTGLKNCTLSLKKGEVIGLAGLEGSGQEVFLRAAAGLIKPIKGNIEVLKKVMTGKEHHKYKELGVHFLPASRMEEGLIAGFTITEHLALQDKKKSFFVEWKKAEKKAAELISDFNVKGKPQSQVESLSGGNQQRLLLGLLPKNSNILLLENPTRGLDVDSANKIWKHLHKYPAQGKSIIFSSSELDEILGAADRVVVFFEGQIVKDVKTSQTNSDELGKAIAGKIRPKH